MRMMMVIVLDDQAQFYVQELRKLMTVVFHDLWSLLDYLSDKSQPYFLLANIH